MTLVKNILFVIFAIVASVAIFNAAEAADNLPINVKCYSGGVLVLKSVTHHITFSGQMIIFRDFGDQKFEVPQVMCIINYGRV